MPLMRLARGCTTNRYRSQAAVGPPSSTIAIKMGGTRPIPARSAANQCSNSTCTSYEQINQSTVGGAITLHRASGCAINITGGTEVGHASGTYSHWNGYKIDITKYTCIGNYIHNSFTYIGLRGDGYPQWRAASGNLYCDEGSHWDITYYTCGC